MIRTALALAGLLVGLAGAAGCSDDDAQPGPDAARDGSVDATLDASVDAAPDSGRPDGWITGPPCDATFIELPPSGETDVLRVDNRGDWVAYDDTRSGSKDVYLFDLRYCEDHRLTFKSSSQSNPSIWEGTVLYADLLDPADIDRDLILFDIPTQVETKVVSAKATAQPIYNGRYVAFKTLEGLQPQECCHLKLLDLLTGDEFLLAENTTAPEDVSLSETHVAWVGYGGPGKDVFYADLETQTVVHVESTYEQFTAFTSLSGDYLVWTDQRSGDYDIYGIRLSTGEELQLTTLEASNLRATVRDDVLCFNTTYWTEPGYGYEIAVQDLRSGAIRRVTHAPDYGYKCGYVDSGWLAFQLQISSYNRNKIFAVNLHALGILDDDGRVVPDASDLVPWGP